MSQVVNANQKHKKKKNVEGHHRCGQCNRTFGSSNALTQHKASPVHSKRNTPCIRCNRNFKTTSGVAQHLEAKCFCGITETVIRWDTNHCITSPIYTDRIQEIYSDDEMTLQVVLKGNPGLPRISDMVVSHILNAAGWNAMNFRCPQCQSHFSAVSSLIQHLESGKCGLTHYKQVNQIYTGMYDMFKGLLKN